MYIKAVAVMKKQPLAPNPTPTSTPEVIKKTIPTVETPDRANGSSPDLSKTKELETKVPYFLTSDPRVLFFLRVLYKCAGIIRMQVLFKGGSYMRKNSSTYTVISCKIEHGKRKFVI